MTSHHTLYTTHDNIPVILSLERMPCLVTTQLTLPLQMTSYIQTTDPTYLLTCLHNEIPFLKKQIFNQTNKQLFFYFFKGVQEPLTFSFAGDALYTNIIAQVLAALGCLVKKSCCGKRMIMTMYIREERGAMLLTHTARILADTCSLYDKFLVSQLHAIQPSTSLQQTDNIHDKRQIKNTENTQTKHNSEQESCAIAKTTARCALYK